MSTVLTIVEGKDLKAMDYTGKSDPFVRVEVMKPDTKPKQIFETEYIEQTLTPVWNETLRVGAAILTDSEVTSLRFMMYDRDAFSNDFMGQVEIPIAKFKTNFDDWFPLAAKSGKKEKDFGFLRLRCCAPSINEGDKTNPWEEANRKINAGDFQGAVPFLEQAIEAGYVGAQRDLAVILERGLASQVDVMRARKLYTQCAKNGCAVSNNNLGFMLQHGIGGTKNSVDARDYYQTASDSELPAALYNLGYCSFCGIGGRQDVVQARDLFTTAGLVYGYPPALNNLGFCYQFGIGGDKDENQAMVYFKKAADMGYPAAMVNLGQFLQFVKRDEESLKKARELFEAAIKADSNYGTAWFCLGYCHEAGVGGPADPQAARNAYEQAVKNGEPDGNTALNRLNNPAPAPSKRKSTSRRTTKLPTVVLPEAGTGGGAIPVRSPRRKDTTTGSSSSSSSNSKSLSVDKPKKENVPSPSRQSPPKEKTKSPSQTLIAKSPKKSPTRAAEGEPAKGHRRTRSMGQSKNATADKVEPEPEAAK